jgi:hypothetical protein
MSDRKVTTYVVGFLVEEAPSVGSIFISTTPYLKNTKNMSAIFTLLFFVALIGLVLGLIKPSIVRMKSRAQSGLTFGIAAIVFLIVSTATFTPATPSALQAGSNSATQQQQPMGPQTSQQKLQTAIQSDLPSSWSIGNDYGNIDISSDTSDEATTRPAGSQYVEIHINAVVADDNSFITQTGQLTTNIFQQAFQIDPTFYDVSVRYEGQTTDQYGNSTTSPLMVYTMDRPLYGQINWSGLSAVQNDVHMCAFLREQANETNAFADGRYIGCNVFPYDLRGAESAIEVQNVAQYPDISE